MVFTVKLFVSVFKLETNIENLKKMCFLSLIFFFIVYFFATSLNLQVY